MKRKCEHVRPRFKLWISSDEAEGVFGDGKWRLLDAINKQGSLRAAAEALKISYRKAWGDLRKAEEYLGRSFVEKHRGGAHGGEAVLTKAGKAWTKAYAAFRSDAEHAVAKAFAAHLGPLLQGGAK